MCYRDLFAGVAKPGENYCTLLADNRVFGKSGKKLCAVSVHIYVRSCFKTLKEETKKLS